MIFFDIETIPEQLEIDAKARIAETIQPPKQMTTLKTINEWRNGEGKYEGVRDRAIEHAYRETSFNAAKGQICSISWAYEDEEPYISAFEGVTNEFYVISKFFAHLSDRLKAASGVIKDPYFVGHDVQRFDLTFLHQRCVVNRIKPPFKIPYTGRHGIDLYDTKIGWAGYKSTISQDNLCKALGMQGKPDDIDGSKVWDFVKAGNIERVAEYNRDDVEKVREIYNRLTFN
ncbi:MAG: ribonuclease H [Planctomycetes bacterium]|nr:ribonuclease H [Planctomycetota bacterium]